MERTDFQKRHQSHGKYERLVAMGKDAFAQGHAPSVTAGIEAACHADPATAALALAGPKDPQWAYMKVIKAAMGYVDPRDAEQAHKNVIRKACPEYWAAERRGQLMQPAAAFVAEDPRESRGR